MTIIRKTLAIVALCFGGTLWGAAGDQLTESNLNGCISSIDGATQVLVNRLVIPATETLPAGSKVTIQSIGFAYRNSFHPYLVLSQGGDASKASTNAVTSTKTVTKTDSTTQSVPWIEYAFNDIEVTVGAETPCYQRAASGGSSVAEKTDLHLAQPSSFTVVRQSSFSDRSLIYEVKYTVIQVPVTKVLSDGDVLEVAEAIPEGTVWNVSCAGSITVQGTGDYTITSADFAKINTSGVTGAVKRPGLTPGVIGFNFNANGVRNGGAGEADRANDTSLALELGTWYKDAQSPKGSSTALFADGFSTLTWSSQNTYTENATPSTFIQGYLDDGSNVYITLDNVPYESYDLILYCSTDDASKSFKAKTVNGKIYTWDAAAGAVVETNDVNATWGLASAAAGKAVIGSNTIRINGLTGPLSIAGGTSSNNARGCISALQLMPAGTSTAPTMNAGTAGEPTEVSWSDSTKWDNGRVATSGAAILKLAGDVVLTVDSTVSLNAVTVEGAGALTLKVADGKSFTASSLTSVKSVTLQNPVTIGTIVAPVIYDYAATAPMVSTVYGATYQKGTAPETEQKINPLGGSLTLKDGTFAIGAESWSAIQTAIAFTDATVTYGTTFGIGTATYTIGGTSAVTAPSLWLSQGAPDRTAVLTLKDTASVTVTGTTSADSNASSVMFGHWDGPSTFTIQDDATFTAGADVLVGLTHNNHTLNVNGGTFTASGIKLSGNASGNNALNINGGVLKLGTTGITSYSASRTMAVTVAGDAELCATAATLPVSQAMTLAAGKTLSLTKADGVTAAEVQFSGNLAGEGTLSVGAGVTLALGVVRSATPITLAEGASMSVRLANNAEMPTLKVTGLTTDNLTVFAPDGETVIANPRVTTNDDGTVTIKGATPEWTKGADAAFATAGNWSTGEVPTDGDIVIAVTEDTVIDLGADARSFTSITISGAAKVSFSGTGGSLAGAVSVVGGAEVTTAGALAATTYAIEGDCTLVLDGTAAPLSCGAVISGAGKVATTGDVTFTVNNTFTGGLTVRSGTTATTVAQGYGPYSPDWGYGSLKTVKVEDGGCLDLNNTKDNGGYHLIIAGRGVALEGGAYSGAVKNSGGNIGGGARQSSYLELAADAMISCKGAWGLVHSGHNPSGLKLNGHTLTKTGAAEFLLVNANACGTTGKVVVQEGEFTLYARASNLTGVDVVLKGTSNAKFYIAPTAIGSLTLIPSGAGISATSWNVPAALVTTVKTTALDYDAIGSDPVTLFTAPESVTLDATKFSVLTGGLFGDVTVSDNTITVAKAEALPAPYLHYDFNAAEVNATAAKAADSQATIGGWGDKNGNGPFKKGRGAYIFYKNNSDRQVPYWGSLSGVTGGPMRNGAMSVVTVAKLTMAGQRANTSVAVWSLGTTGGGASGVALVADDANTVSAIKWNGSNQVTVLATVTDIPDLTTRYHVFVLVTSDAGTKLYVDRLPVAESSVVPPVSIGMAGQFGSLHGGLINAYPRVSENDDGFILDEFFVYDYVLPESQRTAIIEQWRGKGFSILIR